MKRVTIGTRGSDLAMAQARHVAGLLRKAAPEVEVGIEIIRSKGDRVQDVPLSQFGSKGVFTKELEVALLEERIDLAVHSLKDLPTELPAGLRVAATPARENPMDAWIARDGVRLRGLPEGARVGTSSPRRKAQLLALRPDLQILDIRGNVPTRIQKMRDGQYDAIVLAMAGLIRLELDSELTEALTPEVMLPAVGQGALGIEIREDDESLARLLQTLHDARADAETRAERALLAAMGGGCQAPIGALARAVEGRVTLAACVCHPNGEQVLRASAEGAMDAPEALGRKVADLLKAQGAAQLLHTGAAQAPSGKPLAGKRVVVTRPPGGGDKLARLLERAGAEVFNLPAIAIVPVNDFPLDDPPDAWDWLIFTSANGVECFAEGLAGMGQSLEDYRAASVCAVGPATAEALRQRGMPVSLQPERFIAEGLVAALDAIEPDLRGKRILMPRGNLARPELAEALAARGAQITNLVVYETVAPEIGPEQRAALRAFRPDCVTFASASSARHIAEALPPDDLAALRAGAAMASIGPITSEALCDAGLEVAVEADQHDAPGLVAAIAAYYTNKTSNTTPPQQPRNIPRSPKEGAGEG